MGRTTIQEVTRYENQVALKVLHRIMEKSGIKVGQVYSMFAAGATIDECVHYILKRLENGNG